MLLLSLFATAAMARVIHKLPEVPEGWKMVQSAESSDRLTLKLALRQQGADALERATLEVSTPGHPNYGMHLTRDQVRSYTAPSSRAVSDVTRWLRDHGVTPSIDNDWVTIRTDVATANKLLDAEFAWYQFVDGSAPKLRTLSYSLPDGLADHVDMVQPTTRFGQLAPRRSTIFSTPFYRKPGYDSIRTNFAQSPSATVPESCNHRVTPDCIKALYNIQYKANATGNLVAFASYLEEYARYDDLALAQTKYFPGAKGQNFSVISINGGKNDQQASDDSAEANLDLQFIMGTSYPIPVVEYTTGGRGPLVKTDDEPNENQNEPYLEFLTYILAQPDTALPQTLSTSYGEEEQSVPPDFALKICNMFMQLGARGVSVLFSSGDSGPGHTCRRMSDGKPYFQPSFPAGCPYVTAVGGTYMTNPEIAVDFSSGGFSSLHARPAYQDAAVSAYLKSIGDTYSAFFNASNRGFPDVAAQGLNFTVFDKGRDLPISGTSASAPVFAGVVALLNAARRSIGKPPLGFLNPWLYNNTAALNDIVGGAGVGCTVQRYFRRAARWNATAGWDPATGLGTPNFPALLAAAAPGVKNA